MEGAEGANSAGGAADPFLSSGASACIDLADSTTHGSCRSAREAARRQEWRRADYRGGAAGDAGKRPGGTNFS